MRASSNEWNLAGVTWDLYSDTSLELMDIGTAFRGLIGVSAGIQRHMCTTFSKFRSAVSKDGSLFLISRHDPFLEA